MHLNFKKIDNSHIALFYNVLVATFFVTVLTFKKGYSYVPMALGIIATLSFLFYRFKLKQKWLLDKEDKFFIFSLIGYFLTFAMSAIFNGDGIREIDNPIRILLLIPLIILFRLYPIKKETVLHFIPIGALVAGCIAIYQRFILNLKFPFPKIMRIQSGNIAILLSLFSIAIAFHWLSKKRIKTGIAYLVFAMFGLFASILTGARGGWLAFIPICFFILFLNLRQLNKKAIFLILLALISSLSFFISKPEFGIQKRYNAAKNDIIVFLEKGNRHSSLGARFDMWENALIGIREKPLLGHGSTGYETFKKKQIETKQMAKTTLRFNSLHNQYLEAFVKRGVVGFMALMAILIIPFVIFAKRLKAKNREVKCMAILGIVHIISHSFFFLSQSFLAHNSGSLFYFFVLILLYHLVKQNEEII
ncbi:O-antigen ligase family protein [Mannheimia haemolytica]|uniref:O-antigen ligase family protein n=1 Tax=Mannheimia haemolytica TaxID=75985 RepID=UPI001ADC551A|nr:O-antigen ligase family protein [Mannheimia haemolytica]UQX79461.1 O-antigen ligase family protein [Mannheimia haemolytica]